MFYQLITIGALAGIFVIIIRRYPQTQNIPQTISWVQFKQYIRIVQNIFYQIPRPKIAMVKIIKMPKIKLPWPRQHIQAIGESAIFENSAQVRDPLGVADRAFVNKDYDLAEKMYLKAAAAHPHNPRPYSRLGVIYLQQKNYKDAQDALLVALKYEANVASRHYNLALAYQGMGAKNKAIVAIKKALELDPGNEKYESLRQKLES